MRSELKEPERKGLENSQPVHITKNEKTSLEENTKGMVDKPFNKEISLDVNHRPNLPA